MNPGLTLCDFTSGYRNRPVIEPLNICALPPGKITILLGPNGCGKSTLLRALAGLHPAQGALWLNGEELLTQPLSRRARRVVCLPQSLPAGVHLQVLESVLVARVASGGRRSAAAETEVMDLLQQLGIAHLALCYLDQLSGGQKQLVGLAQSLIRQPELLLLDEPLSALDLNYQFHVMTLIARETRRRNMVTLMVVHDINLALRHGDYVLMLQNGRLVTQGPPEQVITSPYLAQVYGVQGRIEHCSQGLPVALIDGVTTPPG
ncbi:iron ABC transporter ATP-binding protein [Erwinia sp. OLTSP20]|uniref:ABC transporter ATP-binding protein n=1 Tax=unclassified Erwinia TaxID=2622719 RepID=UPI000C191A6D|nr:MULTISPECIES: ABC transporter ATP-binding protein [unclassified Erwinia]PIJ50583.1 iron ABC transporter ATP-binding protein [Erwinia sp. OAMSP11]PIJ72901.1 iron ABC transporter ATP-binding protein [Erwinia sp. OLSSP12]PIJ82231.1 iron ABC transporter ATP-binding protein [Erwinia sp. OLCASP19]PIJ84784.1 iron ABC transporter ATP-binding protein [Erwinia sp. OLMTSP26]PIJ86749.1 iron ABC transporter ATP-binding protein [Erwinia sp. OLMDSP33]